MPRLEPFATDHAPLVAGWLRSPDESSRWASIDTLPDAAMLAAWHAEPGVVPYLARDDVGRVIAYGEVWEDHEEGEAELARLIVAPDARGRGIGRWLARALADEAHRRGFEAVWLRVVPDNEPALRAYAAAGFSEAAPHEAAAFDAGQPRAYRWFRATRA